MLQLPGRRCLWSCYSVMQRRCGYGMPRPVGECAFVVDGAHPLCRPPLQRTGKYMLMRRGMRTARPCCEVWPGAVWRSCRQCHAGVCCWMVAMPVMNAFVTVDGAQPVRPPLAAHRVHADGCNENRKAMLQLFRPALLMVLSAVSCRRRLYWRYVSVRLRRCVTVDGAHRSRPCSALKVHADYI
jgi:hypothetical protein